MKIPDHTDPSYRKILIPLYWRNLTPCTGPNVLGGESQVCTDECFDRFDSTLFVQFMNKGDLDHPLERLDICHSCVNALPFGLGTIECPKIKA